MRTIGRGIALGAAPLGLATSGQAQETELLVGRTVERTEPTLGIVPSDTLPPGTRAELLPGMLMRVRLAVSPYGIPRSHGLTARYMDQEPGALLFETDAPYPNRFRRVANDEESYRYLAESIRRFPAQETLLDLMRDAGLED